MSLKSRLPAGVRRPLGRLKRAVAGTGPTPTAATAPAGLPVSVRAATVPVTQVLKLDPQERLALRRRCALDGVAENPRILEIGASHNATFARRDGYDTKIVDHLDRDGLVAKYQHMPEYDMDEIEDVDFVLHGGLSIADVVDEKFDVVYASHVLEHSTSLVHFIRECAELLEPDGVLALVLPDKRYCFDRFRERSSLGRVIDTYYARPDVHTLGTLVESALMQVNHRGTGSWLKGHRGTYQLTGDPADSVAQVRDGLPEEYVDVHNWVVTPQHLRLLLQDLRTLGFIDVAECSFHDTVGMEFFVNLSRTGEGTGLTREELLVLADGELTSMELPVFGPVEP